MRYLEKLGNLKPHYTIITGDGLFDLRVIKGFCRKYNGNEIILWIPNAGFLKKTGLHAFDALKIIPGRFKINQIICILDGDSFKEISERGKQIQAHLSSISVNIEEISSIQDSFLIKCTYGGYKILLYVIISGPGTFIEEEVVRFLKVTRNIEINLSGKRDGDWKARIKREVMQALRTNDIKLEKEIPKTGRAKLEASFPSLSAIFKRIEEEHHN